MQLLVKCLSKIKMKYFIILMFLACSTSSEINGSRKCREFEDAIKKNWTLDEKRPVYRATLSFLDSVATVYSGCVINRDTAYMFKIFGRLHTVEAPIFGNLNKEYNLKITYEFNVSTKPELSEPNISLCYGVDSLGVVRCVRTLGLIHSKS